jgi:predicted TIM-barrel fold metal-dependent hydrolase
VYRVVERQGALVAGIPKLISPDDHIQEPAHLWQSHLPAGLRDRGPRVERLRGDVALNAGDLGFIETPDGSVADVWHYESKRIPIVRIAAAVGVPRGEVDARPVTFDDIRKGCYDPAARLADMDVAGIEASLCYPNMFVRFCGQTFSLANDKDLALACIRAYNDYIVEEWCAASAGRLVPMGIVPLWDIKLAVAEARRLAELDFRSITFSEAPHLLGFPSIHSGYWDPLFDTCAATNTVVSLHIGTGGFPMLARDAPAAVPNVMASFNAGYTLTDLLFSGVFARFPRLKVCLAESQLGWIPYVLSRADFVWQEMSGEGFTGIDRTKMPKPPSEYFRSSVWVTFFRDPVGLELIDRLGADRVLYETDYPHTDSVWPDCQTVAADLTANLDASDAAAVVAGNARALFRVDTVDTGNGNGR